MREEWCVKRQATLRLETEVELPYVTVSVPDLGQKFETGSEIPKIEVNLDATAIKFSGNSYGFEACQFLASEVLLKLTNIKEVDFSNIFVSRSLADLPRSLKTLITALGE